MFAFGVPIEIGLVLRRWVSDGKLAFKVSVIPLIAMRSGPVRLSLTRASTCWSMFEVLVNLRIATLVRRSCCCIRALIRTRKLGIILLWVTWLSSESTH